MKGQLVVDTTKFNAFLRDLRRVTGKSQRTVIRAEAAKIVEKAASSTKAAKAESIRKSHTPYPDGKRKWTRLNGKLYNLTNRYNDQLWSELETQLKERKDTLLARRGLSKKSFLVMAQAAGLVISTPGFVVRAEGFDLSQVTGATEEESGNRYVLTLSNDSTTNAHSNAVHAFSAAATGRMKYFQNNLRKGVFDDIKATTKKYPGIYTNGG